MYQNLFGTCGYGFFMVFVEKRLHVEHCIVRTVYQLCCKIQLAQRVPHRDRPKRLVLKARCAHSSQVPV